MPHTKALALLILAGTAVPAFAQTAAPSTDEVVQMEAFNVTTTIGAYHEETSSMATKIPTDLKELSSSLQILNANSISDKNAVTLQDVFQYVIGIAQSQQNVNGFTFRGFSNSGSFTQNIEYDGLQGGELKKGAQSAANVESIEFLKGPNSVLYGQMKPGGLLNIVTKSPEEQPHTDIKTTFSTYAGRYDSFGSKWGETATIDTTGPVDAGKHLLYRIIVDAETQHPFRIGDYDKLISAYPSLTYRWTTDTYLTVKLVAAADKRRTDDGMIPIFTNGTAFGANARWTMPPLNVVYQDPTDVSRDYGESLSTYFQKRFGDNWTFRAQERSVWHMDTAREFTNNNTSVFFPKAAFATPATQGLTRQYNHVINGHRYHYYDANLYGTFGPEAFSNTLIVGVGGGQEYFDNSRYGFGPNVTPIVSLYAPILGQSPYPPDGTGISSPYEQFTSFGAYALDQIRVATRLHLTLGTRYNQQNAHAIDIYKPLTTPYVHQFVTKQTSSAGAVYDLTKQLSVYANWSQSFLPNDVTAVDASGRSNFGPETGTSYEAGLKFETPSRNLYTSLAYYWIDRENVLTATGTNLPVTGQPIQQVDGAQHSEGWEVETQWQPWPYFQIQGGVAIAKAFVYRSEKNPRTQGDDLINAPRGSGNLWARYNVPGGVLKGFGAGLGWIYVGKYWGGSDTTQVYFPVPGYTRADLAFYYKWKRYDFALNIQNLFDRKYILAVQAPTAVFEGDERKLTLSVETRF
jgi:iron complex outermembrane receptor protein